MKLFIRNEASIAEEKRERERELEFYLKKVEDLGSIFLMCKDLSSSRVDYIAEINRDGVLCAFKSNDVNFSLNDWPHTYRKMGKFDE